MANSNDKSPFFDVSEARRSARRLAMAYGASDAAADEIAARAERVVARNHQGTVGEINAFVAEQR